MLGDDKNSPLPREQDERLSAALGYAFCDPHLLLRALTHRSCVNERPDDALQHNERLEFLGDAVVDLSISHYLMARIPEAREGQLSKLRAAVVSEAGLARAAEQLQLGACLRLGRGEDQTGGRQKPSILADAFEAVIGAVYLDGGYGAADAVVRRLLAEMADAAIAGDLDRDHKTRLQELAQARLQQVPRYEVIGDAGPDHAKVFEVAVYLDEREIARAQGGSKKEAEQRAAELALTRV